MYFQKIYPQIALIVFLITLTLSAAFQRQAFADWITDLDPPTCNLLIDQPSPLPLNETVNITVTSTDNISLSSLTLTRNGSVLATGTTSPLTYSWTTDTAGSYTFEAQAMDSSGNIQNCSAQVYSVLQFQSWIKVFGGDVHSNR